MPLGQACDMITRLASPHCSTGAPLPRACSRGAAAAVDGAKRCVLFDRDLVHQLAASGGHKTLWLRQNVRTLVQAAQLPSQSMIPASSALLSSAFITVLVHVSPSHVDV